MNNIFFPDYYKQFTCLAGSCPDTCCAAWEICIDDDTYAFYKTLNGDFGKRLQSNIAVDEDGEKYFRLKKGRCPFLNSDELCDIHIQLGEEHTCSVCREHPRFTEIYDGFTEISLSVSCPAANRIIFGTEITPATYPQPVSDGKDPLLEALIYTRSEIIEHIISSSDILSSFVFMCEQSAVLSNRFYEYNTAYDYFYVYNGEQLSLFEDYLYRNSEVLSPDWLAALNEAASECFNGEMMNDFIARNIADIKKAFAYFVYRYFLKSVNDEEIELNGAFIALCVFTCLDMSAKGVYDFKECVRLFSKEIEHDTDNIELIKDYIAEKGICNQA